MKTSLLIYPHKRNAEKLGHVIAFLDGKNTELCENGGACTMRVLSEPSEEELLRGIEILFENGEPTEIRVGK